MTLKNGDRFTVYDAMEASGYFSTNPANPNSRNKDGQALYQGPVKFPMMLYHPRGEERVSVPGTKERTPYGTVEMFGEQWEIISREVRTEAELSEALAEGWHKHPAMAIKIANETWRKERGLAPMPVPPISAGSRIADLEEQNKHLTELLEEAKRNQADLAEADAAFVPPAKGISNVAKAGLV
jgi:hypothetical protein